MRLVGFMGLFLGLSVVLYAATPGATSAVKQDGYEKMPPPRDLTAEQAANAASNYQQYCALCHGENREGYKNDHAPSLKSKSLLQTGVPHAILRPMSYGRVGTAMGGYLDEVGGPLTLDEAWDLTYWLFWQEDFERLRLSENPVAGDAVRGADVFAENCASCHGVEGQGGTAPALTNPSALAHNKDEFLRYAIREGRDGTPMKGFEDRLSDNDIDNVTAYLRSKASSGAVSTVVLKAMPGPEDYVLNKDGADPVFDLIDDQYVSATDLNDALNAGQRMVLLDTRVPSVWQRAHIAGSIPLPYYTDMEALTKDLPKDVQIVAYCSCPRAAADYVVSKLTDQGYTRTAVMYEGIFGWMNMGYPVMRGEGLESASQAAEAH